MSTLRKLARLGPHPLLIVRYVLHQVLHRLRLRRLRRAYTTSVAGAVPRAGLDLPPLDLPPAAELPAELREAAERVRREAEDVLDHRVDYLGSGPVDLGPEIEWHRDFKSGYRWPPDFYLDVEVTRLDDDSDAKVPWELSRGHQLLTLARAAVLFDDERHAVELERQLGSWLDANPPGRGINWTNAMEVALRAVNWIWALATLEARRPLERALRHRVVESLQVHGRHVAANLEGSPYLRSNHFLADVLGLLVLGATIKGDPQAKRWLRLAHRGLEREIRLQVHEDGVGFEASLPYHGLALEMLLLAKVVADWGGVPFSAGFDRRLQRMLVASRALRHPNGRLPQIGDADSGRVLPGGFDRPPTLDNLLWLGAAATGGARPLPDPPHAETAWTLGLAAWREAAARPEAGDALPTAFPDGGLYVLRSGRLHAVARCGDVGQNGNGGHAHNDLLSYELSAGATFVVDSGTYVYTADATARNEFRSTRAHNTVVVGGAEQRPIDPVQLFALRPHARPRVESWEETPGTVRFVGSHNGFRGVGGGLVHCRRLELDRRRHVLRVRDEVLGRGPVDAESLVHLAAGTTVERDGAVLRLSQGEVELQLRFSGVDAVDVEDGWVSNGYGMRSRAPVVVARVAGEAPLELGYELQLEEPS